MSRWGGLEEAIVSQLKDGGKVFGVAVPGLDGVRTIVAAATTDIALVTAKAFPAVVVLWTGFTVTRASAVTGTRPQPMGTANFVVQVFAQSGLPAGGGRHGGYDILDRIRELLTGFIPPPAVNEAQHPVVLVGEDLLDVDGGVTMLQARFSLDQVIKFAA